MIESFVDLNYRGLSLGRRIKLTQVRPTTGYLEHPTPMPVGTQVAISTDEGVSFEAVVTHVHEQVGGSDKAPGMTVRPQLADDRASSWWSARVALPEHEEPKPVARPKPITVRPRSHTIPEPIVDQQVLTEDVPNEIIDDGKKTTVMDAVDPELLAQLGVSRTTTGEQPVIDDGKKTTVMDAVDPELLAQLGVDPPVIDDGKQTTIMESVDPAALGLEVSSSGSFPVQDGDEDDASASGEISAPTTGNGHSEKPRGSVKRRKKRR